MDKLVRHPANSSRKRRLTQAKPRTPREEAQTGANDDLCATVLDPVFFCRGRQRCGHGRQKLDSRIARTAKKGIVKWLRRSVMTSIGVTRSGVGERRTGLERILGRAAKLEGRVAAKVAIVPIAMADTYTGRFGRRSLAAC